MARYDYLIVGGGMTADAAVHGIRERDARGTIAVIGAEPDAPYNRPPLTKGLWKGEALDSIWRKTPEADIELQLGRRVVTFDATRKQVTDDQGATHGYRSILLATGGEPRTLPGGPEGIVYFRTLADYRRTRVLSDRGASFIVIGGGFIGSEIAAALRLQGREVTMVLRDRGIGARVFPKDLSASLVDYYREKGVTVHLGDSVNKVDRAGDRFVVTTARAGSLEADAVIAGLGISPATALAEQAGLPVDDGIVVDQQLRAGRDDVYAAGDVARFHNPALGKRIRVEHEDNANTMGKVAGLNMAGAGQSYDHLPFFYSDLFDKGYEAVGDVDARLETVADWKEPFAEGVVYYLERGRVRGVLLWNTWNQVDAARALIAEPGPFGPEQLRGRLPA
ncbi:MAG TPA: FAD-dependent oxidoreductase [Gemmatimonadales bacterium]|nr:FAD-dependent oxidoreductase [Gemmatimonadales bacterium]